MHGAMLRKSQGVQYKMIRFAMLLLWTRVIFHGKSHILFCMLHIVLHRWLILLISLPQPPCHRSSVVHHAKEGSLFSTVEPFQHQTLPSSRPDHRLLILEDAAVLRLLALWRELYRVMGQVDSETEPKGSPFSTFRLRPFSAESIIPSKGKTWLG